MNFSFRMDARTLCGMAAALLALLLLLDIQSLRQTARQPFHRPECPARFRNAS